jgi:hypothetical protein
MGAAQSAEKLVALKSGKTRVFRSRQQRREIVEETLKPGVSVSLIARAHAVNANQVYDIHGGSIYTAESERPPLFDNSDTSQSLNARLDGLFCSLS